MSLDKQTILEALKQVYDPEIPVDIINLGLIYDVAVEDRRIHVKLTTTAPGCPVGNFIAAEIKKVISDLVEIEKGMGRSEGIPEIVVETVYDPPWKMEMVSEEGRRMLGWE